MREPMIAPCPETLFLNSGYWGVGERSKAVEDWSVCVCVCACVPVAPHLPRSIFSTHFVRRSATQCSIGLVCFFYFLGLISTPASILTCSEARKQKYFVLPALDLVFYLVDGFDGSGVEALGEPRDRLFARPISLGESVECKYFFYAAEVVVAR